MRVGKGETLHSFSTGPFPPLFVPQDSIPSVSKETLTLSPDAKKMLHNLPFSSETLFGPQEDILLYLSGFQGNIEDVKEQLGLLSPHLDLDQVEKVLRNGKLSSEELLQSIFAPDRSDRFRQAGSAVDGFTLEQLQKFEQEIYTLLFGEEDFSRGLLALKEGVYPDDPSLEEMVAEGAYRIAQNGQITEGLEGATLYGAKLFVEMYRLEGDPTEKQAYGKKAILLAETFAKGDEETIGKILELIAEADKQMVDALLKIIDESIERHQKMIEELAEYQKKKEVLQKVEQKDQERKRIEEQMALLKGEIAKNKEKLNYDIELFITQAQSELRGAGYGNVGTGPLRDLAYLVSDRPSSPTLKEMRANV